MNGVLTPAVAGFAFWIRSRWRRRSSPLRVQLRSKLHRWCCHLSHTLARWLGSPWPTMQTPTCIVYDAAFLKCDTRWYPELAWNGTFSHAVGSELICATYRLYAGNLPRGIKIPHHIKPI